jgi:hypothetical protein
MTFAEILAYHAPLEHAFTLLRVVGIDLAGAACFFLREADIFVDYIMRNDRFLAPEVPVGSFLLKTIELFAASSERGSIRLEAFQEDGLIEWYLTRGFAIEGPPRSEPVWGTLLPLVKPVARAAFEAVSSFRDQ